MLPEDSAISFLEKIAETRSASGTRRRLVEFVRIGRQRRRRQPDQQQAKRRHPRIDLYLQEKPYVDTEKLKLYLPEKESFPFDAIKLSLAIGNLVDNAFKYAGDFSEILVKQISKDGNYITCTVSDDGNGIPPKIWDVLSALGW